ncbi:MAG: MFS transporter [Chloroflexia bacterium]
MAQKPEDGAVGTTPGAGRWVLIGSILASSMAFIDGSALNVALPALQRDLGANGAEILWIINGYLLMLAAFIVLGGALGDQLGRKRVFMAGIAVFGLASLACGLAPTTLVLIGARVVQGIGGALMIPGSLALISAAFGPSERGKAIGTWSAVTTLVTVAGPILGGFLADAGLWRGVFLINLPIGIAALLILWTKVAESRNPAATGPIDLPGAGLVALGLAGITYGFISAPALGFGDPRVAGALIVGFVALAAFIVVEQHSGQPMVPLRLFRSRTFLGANLVTLLLYGALGVGTLFLSLNLVQSQGYTQTEAGLSFTPFALLLAGLSRWAGGLIDRFGPRLPLVIGPALAGCGFLLFAAVGLTSGPAAYWTTFFPGVVVFGLGLAVTVAPLTTAVMGAVPGDASGTASGINNAVARSASVLAIAVVGALVLAIFSTALADRTAGIDLAQSARAALQAQAAKLGGTGVPAGLSPAQAAAVQQSIKLAFVSAFNVVMLICTSLAWLSALIAALVIERQGNAPRR